MNCDAWIEIYVEGARVEVGCELGDHEGSDHYGSGLYWRDELEVAS